MEEERTKRFTAAGRNSSVHVICERYNVGDVPLCPKCGAELVVAFTWTEANERGRHPGIFCPSNDRHFQVLFNVASRNPKES